MHLTVELSPPGWHEEISSRWLRKEFNDSTMHQVRCEIYRLEREAMHAQEINRRTAFEILWLHGFLAAMQEERYRLSRGGR